MEVDTADPSAQRNIINQHVNAILARSRMLARCAQNIFVRLVEHPAPARPVDCMAVCKDLANGSCSLANDIYVLILTGVLVARVTVALTLFDFGSSSVGLAHRANRGRWPGSEGALLLVVFHKMKLIANSRKRGLRWKETVE